MQVGSMVCAKYPLRDGDGMGIVMEFKKGGQHVFGLIPDRVKVCWALTGKIEWNDCRDLEVVCK